MKHLFPPFRLAPDSDAAGANPPGAAAKAGDGGAGTPPTGGVDSAAELSRLKAQVETYKQKIAEADQLWDHTKTVLVKGAAPESEASLRLLLQKAGYSTGEIETMVSGGGGSPEPKPQGRKPAPRDDDDEGDDAGGVDPQQEYVKQLEARLRAVEGDSNARRTQDLNAQLDRHIESVLTSDADLKVLLEKAKDPKAAKEYIVAEMRENAKAGLRKYAEATGGRLDTGKFGHYATEAAKTTANKFRSVIGAPQQLGRSPETDSGVQEFLQSKPVELAKGRTGGDGRSETTAFITDRLVRALHQDSEESRL